MQLYNIEVKQGLLLAPMAGLSDWPLRMLCRRYGCEIAYSEMISAPGLIRSTKKTLEYLERPAADQPLIGQVFGARPHEVAEASKMIADTGVAGIDINMGCPVRKVVGKGQGSALMKDIETAVEMTRQVVRAVDIPVSAKIRAGWSVEEMNAPEFARRLGETGIDCLIIHPRTRGDMFRGLPRWEIFPEVVEASPVPVIASGNILSFKDQEMVRSLGADGIMIGRGAIGRPWIFSELSGGNVPDIQERHELCLEHLDMLCEYMGDKGGIFRFRKFLSAYVKGLRGATVFRQEACLIDNLEELQQRINQYFSTLD